MEDLLHTVKLFDMDINVNFLNLNTRDVALADGLQFLRYCFSHNICDELLLVIGGNTKAIVFDLKFIFLILIVMMVEVCVFQMTHQYCLGFMTF